MADRPRSWIRAVITVIYIFPYVVSLIPELQGELIAWRDPRVAMIQTVIVMESTGIFKQPDVLVSQPGLPIYGLDLARCSIDFRDPWSEIETIFSGTADSSAIPIIGGALFHNNYGYFTFG